MWGAPSIDQLPGCGLEVVLRESGDAGMGGVTDQKRFVLCKPLSKSKTCCINFEGSNLKSFLWRKAWRYIRIIFFFIFWFQV